MKYRFYKSLDKKSSFFGIRGSYLSYAVMGLLGALVLAAIVGVNTNGLVGTVSFALLAVLLYAAIMIVQGRYSERERDRFLDGKSIPSHITVPPYRLSRHAGGKHSKDGGTD